VGRLPAVLTQNRGYSGVVLFALDGRVPILRVVVRDVKMAVSLLRQGLVHPVAATR
jgi:hypothetical protein